MRLWYGSTMIEMLIQTVAVLSSLVSGVDRDTPEPPCAPNTARGYEHMFAQVSPDEWGAADISMSIRLKDGRRVWLYGDTLSRTNGFVHSTAITQDEGDLHVSDGGSQLLPNEGDTFYWPETVTASGKRLYVTAAPITITGTGLFDFERHPTDSRVALLRVSHNGDVVFKRWVRTVQRPEIAGDGDDIVILGANHYGYWFVTHSIPLRGGKHLQTMSQNWSDGLDAHRKASGDLRWSDFRPEFTSV